MNDRELLEMAAKAAGITRSRWLEETKNTYGGVLYDDENDCETFWNPLIIDGDALRLAVKLSIHIEGMETAAWASTKTFDAIETYNNDPYAATRRAIVRAAAEIGRADKGEK